MPSVSDPNADLIARVASLEAKVDELTRAPGQTVSRVRDENDALVFATGQGGMLARPYLPIEFGVRQPYVQWIRSQVQVWESLLRAHIVKQHPAFTAIVCGISGPGVGGTQSAGGGAGWLRLTVNGVPALADFRINQGTAGFETPVGPIALPGKHLDPVIIELWGKSDFPFNNNNDGTQPQNAWIAAQIMGGYAREYDPPAALASSAPQTDASI